MLVDRKVNEVAQVKSISQSDRLCVCRGWCCEAAAELILISTPASARPPPRRECSRQVIDRLKFDKNKSRSAVDLGTSLHNRSLFFDNTNVCQKKDDKKKLWSWVMHNEFNSRQLIQEYL